MQTNPLPQLVRDFRKAKNWTQEDMAKRLGLSASRIHQIENGIHTGLRRRNLDNLLLLISKKPKQKGPIMGFQPYIPKKGNPELKGERVRISSAGSITISADTCRAMGVTAESRRKLYWAPESREIGIEFVKTEEAGSASMSVKPNGAANFHAPKFFEKFRIRMPQKPVEIVPTLEAGKPNWIVLKYPDAP